MIKYHDSRKLREEEVHFCLEGKKDKRPQGRFAMVAAAGSWESSSHLTKESVREKRVEQGDASNPNCRDVFFPANMYLLKINSHICARNKEVSFQIYE